MTWASVSAPITALNSATANELVTVGSTTTELDAEAKLLFSGATLTIGNATAEDALIKFDGNAVDYVVGLDDSTDQFVIDKASTLDYSTAMFVLGEWDSQNMIRTVKQPCFSVTMDTDQTGTSAGIYQTMLFDTEAYDVGGNWNSTTNSFTAPIHGKWVISCTYSAKDFNNAAGYLKLHLTTSNRAYIHKIDTAGHAADSEWWSTTITHVADFDTNDTMSCRTFQQTQAGFGTEWYGGGDGCRITAYMLG